MVKYPEDWKVVPLGEVARLQNGYAFKSETYHKDGAYTVVTIANVQDGKFDCEDANRIAVLPRDLQSHQQLKIGDVLVSMTGNVGRVCRVDTTDCLLNQRVGKFDISGADIDYVYTVLRGNDFLSKMIEKGQGGAQPNIGKGDIESYSLPLPPLPEQKRIAAVLGNVDKLIDNLSRRIEKKRLVKQGVMQDLLSVGPAALTQRAQSSQRDAKTLRSSADSAFSASAPAGNLVPRRRLPGFSGEWKRVKLGDAYDIVMGQSPESRYYNYARDGLPLIQGNADIENRRSIVRMYTSQITKVCDVGDVILSVRAPVGAVGRASNKSCLGRGVCALKSDNDYLYHYLVFIENRWGQYSTGSTFDSINSDQLSKVELSVPETLAEQKAIAGVLGAMDGEIAKLEAKLTKYRSLKQGLMNDLLTGEVRV